MIVISTPVIRFPYRSFSRQRPAFHGCRHASRLYCPAQLLGQLPLTPGGLGAVESGLTGTLAFARVAAAPAALATLAYRLASFWLSLPVGLAAWIWHRRRFGSGAAYAAPSPPCTRP